MGCGELSRGSRERRVWCSLLGRRPWAPVWGAHQHMARPAPSLCFQPCGVCSKIKFITMNFLGCFVSTQPHMLTQPGSLGGKAAVLNALLCFQRVSLEGCLPVGSLCVAACAPQPWPLGRAVLPARRCKALSQPAGGHWGPISTDWPLGEMGTPCFFTGWRP